jgi:membrane protein YqaA with SNARE-associated domain
MLNPLYIGLVAGIGNTIGNIFLYYTGRNGLKVLKDSNQQDSRIGRVMRSERVSRLVKSKSWKEMGIIFFMFINPIPVTTPLVFAMGAARFNLTRFLLLCWTSKTVQGLLFAYLGHFGLRSLLNIFDVFN